MIKRQVINVAPKPPKRPSRPKQGDIVHVSLEEGGPHYTLVVSPTELIDKSNQITVLPISTARVNDRQHGLTVPLEPGAHGLTGVVLCHMPQTFRANRDDLKVSGSVSNEMLEAARLKFAAFMGFSDFN